MPAIEDGVSELDNEDRFTIGMKRAESATRKTVDEI